MKIQPHVGFVAHQSGPLLGKLLINDGRQGFGMRTGSIHVPVRIHGIVGVAHDQHSPVGQKGRMSDAFGPVRLDDGHTMAARDAFTDQVVGFTQGSRKKSIRSGIRSRHGPRDPFPQGAQECIARARVRHKDGRGGGGGG